MCGFRVHDCDTYDVLVQPRLALIVPVIYKDVGTGVDHRVCRRGRDLAGDHVLRIGFGCQRYQPRWFLSDRTVVACACSIYWWNELLRARHSGCVNNRAENESLRTPDIAVAQSSAGSTDIPTANLHPDPSP